MRASLPSFQDLPPESDVSVADVQQAMSEAALLAILDDDPTGSQTVRDVPVVLSAEPEHVQWAMAQQTAGFFVLTNSRSLLPAEAAEANRTVAGTCLQAAGSRSLTFVSRSDSTLRGHFPLEIDVLSQVSADAGAPVDGVVLAPAYIDAGRVTVDSTHWVITGQGATPVGESEFAHDRTFGFTESSLPAWVAERSNGRIPAECVLRITLSTLRQGGPSAVADQLSQLQDGRMAAVDALNDSDLRVLALAGISAEQAGRRLLYRVGPSFARARLGQDAGAPIGDAELAAMFGNPRAGGLIVVGSHVSLTNAQLARLRAHVALSEFELDVAGLATADGAHWQELVAAAAAELRNHSVLLRTGRSVVAGTSPEDSLLLARQASRGLAGIVNAITARTPPSFVVAKGGITSADVARLGLGMRRAVVQGTMLPGIVSVWRSVDGTLRGPYVVFAGNVGDEHSLAAVVDRLERARRA